MSKNIPGIVRRTRRRNEEKVRIVVQPNPYPLEQPGMQQPNVSDPINPQMQPGMQPYQGQPNSMQPGMQPNPMQPGMQPYPGQPNPMQPGMQPNPMQPGMQPNPMQPGMQPYPGQPAGPGAIMPTAAPVAGQVVPMQSNGRWRGDPTLQGAQPFQQGNNQAWQGGPQETPPNMPQQPAQAGHNNQQPANSLQPPATPQQMQQGRNTPPPHGNIPSQPLTPNQRVAPPQYSPVLSPTPAPSQPMANPQYPPAQPQRTPMANPQYSPAQPQQQQPPRTPGSGQLAPTPSAPVGAGLAAPTAQISIELDGKLIQECRLDKPVLTVGRQDGRDIQIKHQSVSRTHAKIIAENGYWVVEDAGSVNGIVFNGHRVQRTAVKNGDRVFIAPNIVLLFKIA